jgi:hypothetical protein
MDTDGDTTMVLVGLVVYVVAVAAILTGFLVADWLAGRKRAQREREPVKANPAAGRELVRVGYRVRTNYHRYR